MSRRGAGSCKSVCEGSTPIPTDEIYVKVRVRVSIVAGHRVDAGSWKQAHILLQSLQLRRYFADKNEEEGRLTACRTALRV